jgi:hypothetical protein
MNVHAAPPKLCGATNKGHEPLPLPLAGATSDAGRAPDSRCATAVNGCHLINDVRGSTVSAAQASLSLLAPSGVNAP